MNKVYVVISENYNMLADECGACDIIGIYKDEEQAKEVLIKEVEVNIKDYEYVLDEESDIELFKENGKGYIRLFYKYQENWDYNCEYSIVEKELI